MNTTFKALLVEELEKDTFTRRIAERSIDDLPDGEVVVRVHYSSLNYKDALSATGNRGVTRNFPHTPGIDAAGEVITSDDSAFSPGDHVIVTSYDLGMGTDGGFGQVIRVPARWVVPVPSGLSLQESMMFGTAGLTAGLSVSELVDSGVRAGDGPVLVTGATGGVGSIAVAILAKIGFDVTAVTGKSEEADYLRSIGAKTVVSRSEFMEGAERPLLKTKWTGVVDCVGGNMLAAAIKSTQYGGAATCCGLVASPDLNINVYPFILRGVRLIGIDSAECPMERRTQVWSLLASEWKPDRLAGMVDEVPLEGLEPKIQAILAGKARRRTLVSLTDT